MSIEAVHIINTYDQLLEAVRLKIITKNQAVACTYDRRAEGRMGMCDMNKSTVSSPFFNTNPSAHWSDYGQKVFLGNRAESLPKAKAWASHEYGVKDWARNRAGSWVPAQVQAELPIPKRVEPKSSKEAKP